MTDAVVARFVMGAVAAGMAALLSACGAAGAADARPTVVVDESEAAEVGAAEDAQALEIDEDITTPEALRASMESRVQRPPLAQMPPTAGGRSVPFAPTTRLLTPETRPAFRPGPDREPYEVGSAVSSEPLGRELITTFAEVDAHGDARLRYVP